MKRAAGYLRVSTEKQKKKGYSLPEQREQCLSKAAELGYELTEDRIISDGGISGKTHDRPGLAKIREWAKNGDIDALICLDPDRFSRNFMEALVDINHLEKLGLELIFIVTEIGKTPDQNMLFNMRLVIAEYERAHGVINRMNGKIRGAKMGNLTTGGARLYGYRTVDRKRVIVEDEAELVRTIFGWVADDGYSLCRAASQLNRMGISTCNGRRFAEQTLHRMLTNPAYKGETWAFKYGGSGGSRLRDRSEWIEVKSANPNEPVTPPIVNKETWERAQKQLKANKRGSRRNRRHQRLLISGRLRCGACGRSMTGASWKRGDGYAGIYRCICNVKRSYYEPCPQPHIKADLIEPLVWNEVSRALTNPDVMLAEIQRLRESDDTVLGQADETLLRNCIKQADDEEDRYLKQYGRGVISDHKLEKEINRVRREREAAEDELSKLLERRKAAAEASIRLDDMRVVLARLADKVQDASHELKLMALDALNITVTVQPNGSIHISGLIPTDTALSHAMFQHSTIECNNGVPFELTGVGIG